MTNLKKWTKALIPMSLMAMTCGFAGEEVADNCCPQTNCCPPTCCKPCCVPQPKKCIDCECYNPQYYDLQCDWGVYLFADFLYWYARETNLDYAYTQQFFPEPVGPIALAPGACNFSYGYTTKHHYVKSNWKPGVRVGIGMNSDCDGWDMNLNWTWLKSKSNNSTTIAPAAAAEFCSGVRNVLAQPWADGNDVFDNVYANGTPFFPSISGHWELSFNQIDWEFGRKFWVSRCMTIRPYTGLRGAWTKTNFNVTAQFTDATVANVVVNDQTFTVGPTVAINNNRFHNKFWGVGLLGGLQPEFIFGDWCGCGIFSLYGNLEGALIWGKFNGKNHVQFLNDSTIFLGTVNRSFIRAANPVESDDFSRMQGILDLGIGIRWEQHWCCDRYSTSIDLGWEHHYWFDFGMYHRPGVSTAAADFFTAAPLAQGTPVFRSPATVDNFVTNLGLGGFVLRFRFDF